MTRHQVVFRVDASVAMGTGHVMRCLTLADALSRDGWSCSFVCRTLPGHLIEWIEQRGYRVWTLPAPSGSPVSGHDDGPCHAHWLGVPWHQDAQETARVLEVVQPYWLVVDHYALDDRWEVAVAPHTGGIVVIDDLADRRHECQWLLDQNLGRTRSDYAGLVGEHCRCLTGLDYALLRDEFRHWRASSMARRADAAVGRVLVTLGGADPDNVTGRVLSALEACQLPDQTEVDVVMGPSAVWLERVRAQVASLPLRARVAVGVTDMARRMALADVAIGAAGATTWERCCLGLPSLVLAIADNQRSFLGAIATAGLARVGHLETLESDVRQFFDNARQGNGWLTAMSQVASGHVDGLGAERVAKCLKATAMEASA